MISLKNKLIVVTGASGAIGSSLSKKLSLEKAKLMLLGRSEQKLTHLNKKLGNSHQYINCDFTKIKKTKNIIRTISQINKIDALIHIAGIGVYKNLENITEKEWDESYVLHTKIPFLLTQSLLPQLQKSDLSLVLNLGTGAGIIPMRGRSAYCSSKFALRGFTLSLAEEFKDRKPHFCLITLGSTLTSFGGIPIEQKEKEFKAGRAYFPVEWVTDKLVEIIKNEKRESEYVLYPGDHGFGAWKKP